MVGTAAWDFEHFSIFNRVLEFRAAAQDLHFYGRQQKCAAIFLSAIKMDGCLVCKTWKGRDDSSCICSWGRA